jgi:MFS family permease
MLIIWLQGIWLPLHGYSYEDTPLWAGIYMLPMMVGFIVMGPLSGKLSDRFGARAFASIGMAVQLVGFVLLTLLPANFDYIWFAVLLVLIGLGQGMFAAPNTTAIMNSVPADQRGVASGMRATFQNAASVISMTMFFCIVTAGLAALLPSSLSSGLEQVGLSASTAHQIASLPPLAALFAAFLGYNPMATLLPKSILHQLPATSQVQLLGKSFFPNQIAGPFLFGMHIAFFLAAALCLIAVFASLVREKRPAVSETVSKAAIEGVDNTPGVVESSRR